MVFTFHYNSDQYMQSVFCIQICLLSVCTQLISSFTITENFTFSTETISFLCAKKILEKLYDNLMFLPQPLKYALICLDAHIINYMPEILPAEGSVYIQVIF